MHHKQLVGFLVLLMTMAVTLAGCAGAKSPGAGVIPSASAPLPSPTPVQLTVADLIKLRWLEGRWMGTGGGVPTFFERYKFENDSTLLVETLADETGSKVTEESRFELKDGQFGHSEGESGSVATAFDGNSITFSPCRLTVPKRLRSWARNYSPESRMRTNVGLLTPSWHNRKSKVHED